MDKTVLRNFAVESRKDLMEKIDRKIKLFYLDEEFKKENRGDVIVLSNDKHTLTLTKENDSNRDKLLKRITELGYDQVVEEAAYTWFNRIIAIRYLEINDYLPLTKDNQSIGVKVLSSKENTANPEILKFTALTNSSLDINFDKNKYSELNSEDDKFKYILLLICRKLGRLIPQVFDGITDYIDLLIPDNLLLEGNFINKLIQDIPEDYFKEVEIIGWLYQYYISEKKDEVMASTSSKKNYQKHEIPFVTQIFTPDWIVKYMVENTLIRYIVEHNILSLEDVKSDFKYLDIEEDFKVKNKIEIKDVKFIDTCCGSGHILVYAFDVFYKIYLKLGYQRSAIPEIILKNNLFGIDIDDRAGQLSILSVLLKARKYDKNIFDKNIINDINIMAIQESNSFNNLVLDDLSLESKNQVKELIDEFYDAKEIGSLIKPQKREYKTLIEEINSINNIFSIELKSKLIPIIKLAQILTNKYEVVVTNPPYLGNAYMSSKLYKFVEKEYSDSKIDLFSAFIQKEMDITNNDGYYSAIVLPSFLFLKSFSKLRKSIINNQQIISLLHMGRGVFGVDFGSTSFVIKNSKCEANSIAKYYKLYSKTFQYIDIRDIEKIYLAAKEDNNYRFEFNKYNNDNGLVDGISEKIVYFNNQNNFSKINEFPISYWITPDEFELFNRNKSIGDLYEVRGGMTTSNTDLFLRYWWEIDYNKIGFGLNKDNCVNTDFKWFPYNKGGNYRKWYGNREYVINWYKDGKEIKEYKLKQREKDPKFNIALAGLESMFKAQISWSLVSAGKFSVRYFEPGFLFDVSGCCVLPNNDEDVQYLLGFLNSNIAERYLKAFNPTMNTTPGDVKNLVFIKNGKYEQSISNLVKDNIYISKNDWDSFETSWDFEKSKLLNGKNIRESITTTLDNINKNYKTLLENETKLNELYTDIYNLNNTIVSTIEDKDISVSLKDDVQLIKEFISYSVGCMFGRYSLDNNGIIFAGGIYDKNKYEKTIPDEDNIIPISDNENVYYDDDIVERFKNFISIAFGKEFLNENIEYIAEVLGKKGTESSEETIRRYFLNDFFNDHVKTYQKRPIYWLFDSGKKNGFKCLIYLHRYDEQIVSKIRTKYLHKTISVYQKTLDEINYKLSNDELNTTEKRELQNKKIELINKIAECNEYDEKVGNVANKMIKLDLDDGVVKNYAKFVDDNGKSILAKIK